MRVRDRTAHKRVIQDQLAAQLALGVDAASALERLGDALSGGDQEAVRAVLAEYRAGASFPDALARRPDMFDSELVELVRLAEGEEASHTELFRGVHRRQRDLREVISLGRVRIIRSLSYFVLLGAVAVVLWLGYRTFVVPGFTDLFDQLRAPLPAFSKAVLTGSGWHFVLAVLLIALPIVGSLIFAVAMKRLVWGEGVHRGVVSRLPGWRGVARRAHGYRVLSSLASLLAAGVPAAACSRAVLPRPEPAESGDGLAKALARLRGLRGETAERLRISEATGTLSMELAGLVVEQKHELTVAVQRAADVWGTLMLLMLAIAVGYLVVAMYLPLFTIGAGF